jgi:glutathione S-transferase
MERPKLTYWDFDGGRGEDCRLAFHIAGVDFEDDRFSGNWAETKGATPMGSLPVLTIPGRGEVCQSNAILVYIGRTYGLHPSDPFEAARHEAVLSYCEELRERAQAGAKAADEGEKKATREAFASGPMTDWARNLEAQIRGPFLGGDTLNVADLKVSTVVAWVQRGVLDYIPKDLFASFSKLNGLHAAVQAHPGVRSWYAKRASERGAPQAG